LRLQIYRIFLFTKIYFIFFAATMHKTGKGYRTAIVWDEKFFVFCGTYNTLR
jgi:hypothetical protein